MLFDTHSHILPNVDDGANGMEESIAMLREMKRQGVDKVLATPHFYARKRSITDYVEKISASCKKLQETVKEMDVPEILCGSEVCFFKGISNNEDIEKLCINSSRYIMIELPYEPLTQRVEDEINDLVLNRNLIPILAHIDRYLKFDSYERLVRLFRFGDVKGQVNASVLQTGILSKKRALLFFQQGFCDFLGSDAHNMTTRPVQIDKAWSYLEKKLGEEKRNSLSDAAESFYQSLTTAISPIKYL